MIPGFGKQTLTLGSAPTCDVVLAGEGVAPEHARLVHQGGGVVLFVDGGQGASFANGHRLAPGQSVPFDLRTPFQVGSAAVPLAHPAISLMLMAQGQLAAPAGQLVIGRDPTRASLVLLHPSVSSQHATVVLDRMVVIDHGSTSGTYLGPARIAPGQPAPLDPAGVIAFGPVPVAVSLLSRLAAAAGQAPPRVSAGAPGTAAVAQFAPVAGPAGGEGAPAAPRKHKTILGQLDFTGSHEQAVKTIGRTPDNNIVVPHPQVSSRHALLVKQGAELYIEDRGSANGTYVRGQRIPAGQRVPVRSGEKVYIGPMPLLIELSASGLAEVVQEEYGPERWAGRPLYEIEAWDLSLEVQDRDDRSRMKVLLDRVSFKALPGDMIALMGPSGAGKTTLLLALNGYLPPSSGIVRINGEDLYNIYDTLRGSIGYVPQDDIVHPELTVFEAVRYSARFRLPPDYSDEEINARVEQTLKDLGLEGVKNLQIGKPEKKILSGGQRKRVNIALELVTDPVILFLDEPTSGLAADDTTALIQLLSELTRTTGKTIIMTIHQPAKDEFERFTHCLIMGYGGVPMYYGPTRPDAYRFFGTWKERGGGVNDVDNPRDMFEMLAQRERPIYEALKAENPSATRGEARRLAALEWRKEFFQDHNATFRKMYSGRREIGTGQGQRGIPAGRATTNGQFGLLLSRYFKVKVRDVMGTAIMLLQAPIIGGLLAIVFGGQKEAIPAWCLGALQELGRRFKGQMNDGSLLESMQPTTDHTGAMFFLVVSAVWFGTSNAAREIVSERAIYLRERMVNLGLWNYLMSKYVLLSLFCVIQCTVLLAIVFFALGFHGGPEAFALELAALVATAMSAVALGLLLSTVVVTSEAAMALTPIALIPQVVLGGLMVPMTTNPMLAVPMYVMPARWGFEAAVSQERRSIADVPAWLIDLKRPDFTSPGDFVRAGRFECATAQMASDTYNGAWGFVNYDVVGLPYAMLGGFTVAMLVSILVLLKRRDPV